MLCPSNGDALATPLDTTCSWKYIIFITVKTDGLLIFSIGHLSCISGVHIHPRNAIPIGFLKAYQNILANQMFIRLWKPKEVFIKL